MSSAFSRQALACQSLVQHCPLGSPLPWGTVGGAPARGEVGDDAGPVGEPAEGLRGAASCPACASVGSSAAQSWR